MARKAGGLSLIAFALALMLVATATPAAADLPNILASPSDPVPECVTPGRLMAYLKLRNSKLDPRYDSIATEYMRQGEMLGMRWDFAFYQMIVETGALSYWRGNRPGDVRPSQNNFGGLGATGRGERGESFPDIETGVRAHLEHLLLYANRSVDNPVAERTRNVREWGVLTKWHQTFTRPITFADLGQKWAPGTRTYARMLQTVADRFNEEVCGRPDPRPELLQEARASLNGNNSPDARKEDAATEPPPSGADLAQRAIEQAKAEGNNRRSALGAQVPPASNLSPTPFKVLNTPPPETASQTTRPPNAAANAPVTHAKASPEPNAKAVKGPTAEKAAVRTASAAAAAKAKALTEAAAPRAADQRCRVWTASYGGQKAMIIRSVTDRVVNFTVLDVNEGSEAREAQAFISAYAKDGKIAGEFPTQTQALDKAFELCPEG